MSARRLPATRFPLLVYQRVYDMWFWPALLVFAGTVALLVLQPPLLGDVVWAFVPVTLITAGLAFYALLARFATVQAHPKALRIRTHFFPLVISYGRLNVIRTTPFKVHYPPDKLSWSQRRVVEKLYGHTCILVELRGYPVSRLMLRLLVNRFLLPPNMDGLVLLVQDWLQLSNEIEGARAEWVNRRFSRRKERTVQRVLRK